MRLHPTLALPGRRDSVVLAQKRALACGACHHESTIEDFAEMVAARASNLDPSLVSNLSRRSGVVGATASVKVAVGAIMTVRRVPSEVARATAHVAGLILGVVVPKVVADPFPFVVSQEYPLSSLERRGRVRSMFLAGEAAVEVLAETPRVPFRISMS